ncbi:MAG: DUF424 domain-containing protein [Conexivisphaerales archaeon]
MSSDKFIINVKSNGEISVLNICDADVLGTVLMDGLLRVYVDPKYFGGKEVGAGEVIDLLKKYYVINLVGNGCVSLAIKSGFGNRLAVKKIQGVDFLMVYKFVDKYNINEDGKGAGHS